MKHLFLGKKSNGAYCAVIPMMRWYAMRDPEYGKAVYPFLRETDPSHGADRGL